jgi:hypothetical protein
LMFVPSWLSLRRFVCDEAKKAVRTGTRQNY